MEEAVEYKTDITLICCECGREFLFSEGERSFYREKGFMNPKRCPYCRNIRKEQREAQIIQESNELNGGIKKGE